jgi:cell filamentation protein
MSAVTDSYLLPNGTLRNKLGITDASELSRIESDLSDVRLQRIETEGPQGPFTFERLKATHHYLFQDIYEWAGESRKTELSKDGNRFETHIMIGVHGRALTAALADDNELKGLSRKDFAEKAAAVFGLINHMHTFREGNGRTQRAFMEALAHDAGHNLDFTVVSRERMIQASIESSAGRPEMMHRLFDEISDPLRVAKLETATSFLDQSGFNWNDRYIATTMPGQKYAGVLVDRDGNDAMFHNGREIFIGNSADIPDTAKSGDSISFTARRDTQN